MLIKFHVKNKYIINLLRLNQIKINIFFSLTKIKFKIFIFLKQSNGF